MPNWWGNMTGAQAVQMGQNIFQMSQQQAAQQRAEQEQQAQLATQNFFRKAQLDLQTQRLGLDKARQDLELQFDEKRMAREEIEAEREQEKWGKIAEYSQGLSEMITDLDFSSPEDMKKLYAFQIKYQPYGIKPEYLKPELPKTAKPLSQKEYGDLVFKVWNGIKDFFETEYKQQAKTYEAPGFFARKFMGAKDQPPELTLPTIEEVKTIVDKMLVRGDTPETIDVNTLINAIIQQTQPQRQPGPAPTAMQPQLRPQAQTPLGPTAPPMAIPPTPQSPYAGAGRLLDLFSPAKRKYNALSPAEKRVADRYMADSGASLEETLQMIEEAKAMKAR